MRATMSNIDDGICPNMVIGIFNSELISTSFCALATQRSAVYPVSQARVDSVVQVDPEAASY